MPVMNAERLELHTGAVLKQRVNLMPSAASLSRFGELTCFAP
jgi:hypothetical protein